jgi:tetratricopeptide (TPR) repeat protein
MRGIVPGHRYNKIMPRALLGSLALAWALTAGAEIDYPAFLKLTRSLMKVEAFNPDGSVSIGTGVVVGRGMIVTSCHVTQHARSIELVKGSMRNSVQAQQGDIERDLCLLYSPHAEDEPIAPRSWDTLRLGQRVYAVGYIFGIAPRLNAGEINALYDFEGGKVIRSSTPFTSGASGGGLFDSDGRLIGIVTFKYRAGGAYHFSLPMRWVETALMRFEGRPVEPLTGSTFWQRPAERQPYFLRAATLEAEQDWGGLARIARQWTEAESGNPSAWHTLGKAHLRMREDDQAINAFQAALMLDNDLAEAWYDLGVVYADIGKRADVERVRGVLLGLDPRLADELSKHASQCGEAAPTLPC